MANQARVNVDTRPFVTWTFPGSRTDNATIEQDAARTEVLARFTLMARKNSTIPATGSADGSNTGDGTVTAVAAALGGVPIAGIWVLTNTLNVTHGGVWKLEDPNGNVVATELVQTEGAGLATIFTAGGITFTITDGATDAALADFFTITVTANGDWVPFDITAVDGSEIPLGIFVGNFDITAAALVADDVEDNPIILNGIKFDKDKLIFDNGTTVLTDQLATGETINNALMALQLIPELTRSESSAENS